MILDELNKKIADIESLATDKTSTIETKVSELQDGLLMVADAVDIIPEMVDEKITAITKEFSTIKDAVKKVKAQKGDKGDRGEPGIDGIGIKGDKGDNGSPDTGEQIASKLNELEGVIDTKVLKDFSLPDVGNLQKQIDTIGNQTLRLLSRPTGNTSAISSVVTNATLTGSGTASSPLGVVGGSPIDDTQIAVRVTTTAALAGSPVYANGSSGVGATLTRGTNGALPAQDGVALEIGDRILIKNQASTLQNGIYEVTSLGSASTKWVLTRTTDADSSQELDEMIVAASEGTTNRAISYGQQTNNPTVGSSAITFTAAPSVALSQATTGTQAINQIPLYTGTARQVTRGTSAFAYDPLTNIFTINSIPHVETKISVSSAEILNLFSSPKTLIAAPGAGKVINIFSMFYRYNFVTTDYTTGGFQQIRTGNNAVIDRLSILAPGSTTISTFGSKEIISSNNGDINLYQGTSNPILGDGTLDIYITYRIVTL